MLLIEYPKCSTCRKAKKWLDEHQIAYTDRHIVEENPTMEELKAYCEGGADAAPRAAAQAPAEQERGAGQADHQALPQPGGAAGLSQPVAQAQRIADR